MRLRYRMLPEVKALGLNSCVVAEMNGLSISGTDPGLDQLKAAVVADVVAMSDDYIASNAVLESYRELVRSIGRSPRKFSPAAENLLRGIKRTQRFPSINTAVDSYNIVVARRLLALGVHDLDKLGPEITFRLSTGGEPFTAVGNRDGKHTQAGDFVYGDDRRVLAWLDSRDSDDVKISMDTAALVIVVQGTRFTQRGYTAAAAMEACTLITRFCGGTFELAEVS